MHGVKASRQLFLFKRGVIIAKRKEDGMLSCKVYIPVSTIFYHYIAGVNVLIAIYDKEQKKNN